MVDFVAHTQEQDEHYQSQSFEGNVLAQTFAQSPHRGQNEVENFHQQPYGRRRYTDPTRYTQSMESSFSFHFASQSRTSSSQSFKHDPSHRQQQARHNGGATTLALQQLLAIKQNCRRALWRLWSALDAGIHFTVTLADGEHSSWTVRRTNSITQETPIPPKTASAPESCSKGRPAARYPGGCPLSRCHMELCGASVEGTREKGYAWCYDQSSRGKRATARIGGSYQNSVQWPEHSWTHHGSSGRSRECIGQKDDEGSPCQNSGTGPSQAAVTWHSEGQECAGYIMAPTFTSHGGGLGQRFKGTRGEEGRLGQTGERGQATRWPCTAGHSRTCFIF